MADLLADLEKACKHAQVARRAFDSGARGGYGRLHHMDA
jgi:hypothetical protein